MNCNVSIVINILSTYDNESREFACLTENVALWRPVNDRKFDTLKGELWYYKEGETLILQDSSQEKSLTNWFR